MLKSWKIPNDIRFNLFNVLVKKKNIQLSFVQMIINFLFLKVLKVDLFMGYAGLSIPVQNIINFLYKKK